MTLKQLVELHVNKSVLSPDTVKKYRSVADIFIRDTSIKHINKIDTDVVINWRNQILNRSSAGNWNNYHRHMRALMQSAVEIELIKNNPFKQIKSVVHYPTKQHILSKNQLSTVIESCVYFDNAWFWKALVKMLQYTGIRRRQLTCLRWSDIDFLQKVIHLRSDGSKTKREYTIPMNGGVVDALLSIVENTKHITNYQNPENQVFNITLINTRYKTNEMNTEHVAKFFTKLSKITKFKVSAHRFRHTLATTLANNGKTSIKTVQNILGHSSTLTTLGYVHPSLENMSDALNLL